MAGQGEVYQADIRHYDKDVKENEIEKCNKEENIKLKFNPRMKTQTARGHILRSWEVTRIWNHELTVSKSSERILRLVWPAELQEPDVMLG